VVQGLQALLGSGVTSGSSDAQLLDRFIRQQGQPEAGAAFEAIVARHGPLILGDYLTTWPIYDELLLRSIWNS